MRFAPLLALAAFAAGALLAGPALATTQLHLDTRALVLGSSEIVVGTIASAQPRWSADKKKIFTDVEVKVSESLKGAPGKSVTLTQLGGELDGIRYSIPGGPLFRPGEEALIFVWRDSKGRAQVNGLAQGKFDIARDAKSGVATVQRVGPGLGVRDARGLEALKAGEPAARIPLDELKREIRRVLANPEAGR